MEKKQTAVEWLLEEWPILESQIPPRIIEQAKEMEKEQIIDAWDLSRRDIDYPADGQQYYN